jgi:plastocyanin
MARLVLAAAGVALVVAVAPALAAQDHTITALGNNTFDRTDLTIAAGDRVRFQNADGRHNFSFEDNQEYPATPQLPTEPGWAAEQSRTFTTAGSYRYFCEQHGSLTSGMRGTITVNDPPPQDPSPSPQPGPSPSPSPGPGGGGGGGGTTPTGGQPAEVRALALAAGSFCARRGPKCRRPGVRIRIDLSAPARVTGTLKRRAKRFGRVDFGTVAAGPRTLRFRRTASGKRLKRGRYSLALSVDGAAAETLRFRVR